MIGVREAAEREMAVLEQRIEELEAELARLRAAGPLYRVPDLEWGRAGSRWFAHPPKPMPYYEVWKRFDDMWDWDSVGASFDDVATHKTMREAMAAANAHHRARIVAMLEEVEL